MKIVLRVLALTFVALALLSAQAAKADAFQPVCHGTTSTVCHFTLTSQNSGVPDAITLYLTGNPAGNGATPNYNITYADGFVKISGTTYAITGIVGTGTLFKENANGKSVDQWLDTTGLELIIPSLIYGGSDDWTLRWVNNGNYWELESVGTTGKNNNKHQDYALANYLGPDAYGEYGTDVTNGAPEPMTLLLFGTGLAGIGGLVRRKLMA